MRIAVISDTHTDSINTLPRRLVDQLSAFDIIIHAGDFTGKTLLDDLRKLGHFRGVHGNADDPDVKRELPGIDTIEAGGFRIGLNHPAEGGNGNLEDRLRRKFQNVQVIIHGHTHRTKNESKEGILWFNPGSATGTFPARKKTYGTLTLDKEVRGELIEL